MVVKSIIKGSVYPEQRINIDYKSSKQLSLHSDFHLDFKGLLFRVVTALVNLILLVKITFL